MHMLIMSTKLMQYYFLISYTAIDFQLQLTGISDCDNWKVDKMCWVFYIS